MKRDLAPFYTAATEVGRAIEKFSKASFDQVYLPPDGTVFRYELRPDDILLHGFDAMYSGNGKTIKELGQAGLVTFSNRLFVHTLPPHRPHGHYTSIAPYRPVSHHATRRLQAPYETIHIALSLESLGFMGAVSIKEAGGEVRHHPATMFDPSKFSTK